MNKPLPSTSNDFDPLLLDDDGKLEGYGKETYTLLKYVFKELSVESDNEMEESMQESPLLRAQRYTGFHIDTLKILSEDNITINKVTEIDRKYIHDALTSFYLDENIMPTATQLYNRLQGYLPPYVDIRSFRKKLIKLGYIFKKIGSSFCVYETPSVRFERFLYLKNIIQYREEKKPIYFLSEVAMSYTKVWNIDESLIEKRERQLRFFFAVSSLKGIQFVKKVEAFNEEHFNSWLIHNVIPFLETSSVVIIDNSKHHCSTFCKTPTLNSPGYEMIEWLTFHQIPFSKMMSRVQLYTLIEKCTDINIRLYKPDTWLKDNGYDVLRLPDCINGMTPAAMVRNLISKSLDHKENLLVKSHEDIINDITISDLEMYNSMLAMEEKRLFELDKKIDDVLDNLQISDNIETDFYLPTLSDSE